MRILAACLALAFATPLHAQRPLTVRIRVLDSARAPIANASVSVMDGRVPVASGVTDRTGTRVIRLVTAPDEFEVVAKRVGYASATRFVARERRDSITVDLTLQRLAQQLDAVRVTAAQSLKKQRLTVDADAIAAFERPLIDATDIIAKMRPDMVYGLGGKEQCPAAAFVWVNGVRIEDPPFNGIMEAKHQAGAQFSNSSVMVDRGMSNAPPPQQSSAGGYTSLRQGPHTAYTELSTEVLSVLASIKPEHIASIEMHDCKDVSIDKKGGSAALFVILKDGVTFEPGVGSRVGNSASTDKLLKRIMRTPPAASVAVPVPVSVAAAPPSESATPLEAFRMRILGVFDATTGAPLDSAEVVDVASGMIARTTETGTVALAFLPVGDNRVVVRKSGFRADTLAVRISQADTLPLTVLIVPSRAGEGQRSP